MTLNLSHLSIFPVSPPDDSYASSSLRLDDYLLIEGIQDNSRLFNLDFSDIYECGRNYNTLRGGSCEFNDVRDLLPSDPFGMNIGATLTMFGMDAFNFILNKTTTLPLQQGNAGKFQGFDALEEGVFVDKTCKDQPMPICNPYIATNEDSEVGASCFNQGGRDPHEAFLYVLGYLGVHELLSVERVCKSMHSVVQSDSFLWRNICIDQSLNEKIDDDALLALTSRAQGNLQCLNLIKCSRVTDDGLKRVLERNTKLEKLSVPECTRLSIEGILTGLKNLHSFGAPGVKQMRIGGRYDVRHDHFEDFKMLLGMNICMQVKERKPRIYHGGQLVFPYDVDEDDVIDIEICPRCENPRLVYDCPVHSCQVEQMTLTCRACTICIPRCVKCGRCVNDGEYVETFCLDKLCLYCYEQEPEMIGASSKSTIVEEGTEY